MKKIFLVLVFTIVSVCAVARSPKGLSIGGGFVNQFYVLNDHPDNPLDNSYYFGPYVELGYDWNIEKMNGFYVGLRYEFAHKYNGRGTYIPDPRFPYVPYGYVPVIFVGVETYTYRHYIDVPIKYRFNWSMDSCTKFFFDLGPTLNFMVGNTTYLNEYLPGIWDSQKINWYDTELKPYNWFNLSIGANIGFFIDQAKVFIGYDYGGILSYVKKDFGRGQTHQLRIGAAYVF